MIRRALISTLITTSLLAGSTVAVAAQADREMVVEVTGSSSMPSGCSMSSVPVDEGVADQERDRFTCTGSIPGSWSMSDPRLEGRVRRIAEASVVTGPGLEALASACAEDSECEEPFLNAQLRVLSIENDEGAWRERPRFLLSFPGSAYAMPFPATWEMVLDGEGAYDGLVAVLRATDSGTGGQRYHGFIIDAELLPPTPENAAAG